MELVIGNLLRIGVLLAAGVTVAGGIVLLLQHGGERPDYGVFREDSGLRSVGGIVAGAARLDGRSIVQLGVLLLIATPVARVGFSLIAFLLQRDRLYVAITAIVLAVLLFSLFLGGAG